MLRVGLSLSLAAVATMFVVSASAQDKVEEGFKSIFDGKSYAGWKINENEKSWTIEDGALVAKGDRSHLFYTAEDDKPFVNFHLKIDVKTDPKSNGGVYFHTKYQDQGWPKYGYEAQVNNSHGDPKKTAGLYAVKDVFAEQNTAKDGEWFTMDIIVEGSKITTKVNGKTAVEFTEEEGRQPGKDFTRKLDKGTFALQAHDPGSTVRFKNIRVKRLP
jgi:hypothetical protein